MYCGISHAKAHVLQLERVTNELWPQDEAKPSVIAPVIDDAVAPIPPPQPPQAVVPDPESKPGVLPVLTTALSVRQFACMNCSLRPSPLKTQPQLQWQ